MMMETRLVPGLVIIEVWLICWGVIFGKYDLWLIDFDWIRFSHSANPRIELKIDFHEPENTTVHTLVWKSSFWSCNYSYCTEFLAAKFEINYTFELQNCVFFNNLFLPREN